MEDFYKELIDSIPTVEESDSILARLRKESHDRSVKLLLHLVASSLRMGSSVIHQSDATLFTCKDPVNIFSLPVIVEVNGMIARRGWVLQLRSKTEQGFTANLNGSNSNKVYFISIKPLLKEEEDDND